MFYNTCTNTIKITIRAVAAAMRRTIIKKTAVDTQTVVRTATKTTPNYSTNVTLTMITTTTTMIETIRTIMTLIIHEQQ